MVFNRQSTDPTNDHLPELSDEDMWDYGRTLMRQMLTEKHPHEHRIDALNLAQEKWETEMSFRFPGIDFYHFHTIVKSGKKEG